MPRKTTKVKAMKRADKRASEYGKRTGAVAMSAESRRFTTVRLSLGQVIPDVMIVPMKYADIRTLNNGLNSASQVYSVNSAYDPDVTGVGSSVTGFATLITLYRRYRVLNSRIKAIFGNNTGASVFAVAPSQVNPGSGAGADVISRYRFAKPHAQGMSTGTQVPPIVITDMINVSEMAGTALYAETDYYGLGSADPVAQFYWVVAATTVAGIAANAPLTVEIEYLVEWSQPVDAPP